MVSSFYTNFFACIILNSCVKYSSFKEFHYRLNSRQSLKYETKQFAIMQRFSASLASRSLYWVSLILPNPSLNLPKLAYLLGKTPEQRLKLEYLQIRKKKRKL